MPADTQPADAPAADRPDPAPLARLAAGPTDPDALLTQFLTYVEALGLELYPAQEEAILELVSGKHVVLNTPTGSGKSLVALALHFAAFAQGKVSVYTSPIKALVNEKFFALCEAFGAENVGMLTGDASINREAKVLCCTAEILANMTLRQGEKTPVDAVIMDEFHYYADRDRGWAWQVPLLELPGAQFLLMSATLGDTRTIEKTLEDRTGRPLANVRHATRPVPLEYDFRYTPLHETIADLVARGRAPIYLVNFTQRAAAEQAQNLTSVNLLSKEEKQAVRSALHGFRFDSPYGRELQRFLHAGVGVHHAGLLPKYRRLVERLAQQNLLRVVSGTDTLGVGVNIPLRTVLFTQLYKFDGEKTIVLPVRDFQQIAGRAGRKGFDDRGWVVAQAPAHVIENRILEAKAATGKKVVKKKPPEKGYAHYDEKTFERLQERQPEPLESRFDVTHGMILQVLQRQKPEGEAHGGGYRALVELIQRSHESDWNKRRLKRKAAMLFRTLRAAGIVEVVPFYTAWPRERAGSTVRIAGDLQREFSMHQILSLYLVETLPLLDPESPTHALDVVTLVESILDSPKVVLAAQLHKAKGERIAELKAQGVEYEQRMEELEKVEHPKPNADFVYATFNAFAEKHPWLGKEDIRPKSIARELVETGATFNEYVRDYGLERSEGVLLRYLTDAYRTLLTNVPEAHRTEQVEEILAFLRATLAAVDTSLLDEWEAMRDPEAIRARAEHRPPPPRPMVDLAANPKQFAARIRAEAHRLARALGRKAWDEAQLAMRDPDGRWTPSALDEAMAPFFAEKGAMDFTPRSRATHLTRIDPLGSRRWRVRHTLLAQDGDDLWMLEAEIDLSEPRPPDEPLLEPVRVGT